MNNKLRVCLFYILIAVVFFSSCKSKKETVAERPDLVPVNNVLTQVIESGFDPLWFSGKADVSYTDGTNSQNITATIRIKRDSVIWASISPGLGIEVARVILTPDSMKILNRLEQTYRQTPFAEINKMLNSPLKFRHLQDLLMGNYPDYVENSAINHVGVEGNDYILSAVLKPGEENHNDVIETLWIHPFTNRIKKLRIDEPAYKRSIEAEYKEFSMEGSKMFPSDAVIKVEQDKLYEVKLKWSKVKINDPLDFPFNIPSGYQKE